MNKKRLYRRTNTYGIYAISIVVLTVVVYVIAAL